MGLGILRITNNTDIDAYTRNVSLVGCEWQVYEGLDNKPISSGDYVDGEVIYSNDYVEGVVSTAVAGNMLANYSIQLSVRFYVPFKDNPHDIIIKCGREGAFSPFIQTLPGSTNIYQASWNDIIVKNKDENPEDFFYLTIS